MIRKEKYKTHLLINTIMDKPEAVPLSQISPTVYGGTKREVETPEKEKFYGSRIPGPNGVDKNGTTLRVGYWVSFGSRMIPDGTIGFISLSCGSYTIVYKWDRGEKRGCGLGDCGNVELHQAPLSLWRRLKAAVRMFVYTIGKGQDGRPIAPPVNTYTLAPWETFFNNRSENFFDGRDY